MVVVKALATCHKGKPLIVERRVRIALLAEAVPDGVDRRVQRHVADSVDEGGKQPEPPPESATKCREADAEPIRHGRRAVCRAGPAEIFRVALGRPAVTCHLAVEHGICELYPPKPSKTGECGSPSTSVKRDACDGPPPTDGALSLS